MLKKWGLPTLLVGALYPAASELALQLLRYAAETAVVWFASGVGLAAMLLLGTRALPGVLLGAGRVHHNGCFDIILFLRSYLILIKGINLSEIYLFRHRVLIPIWAGIGTFALWKMSRGSFNPETMTYLLNTMGLILCILPIYQLISSPFQGRLSQMDAEKEAQALELQVGSAPPDIYYIILDGYGREDVLKDRYGFDNSDFLNTLRNLGFYVADCSQSNYSQTRISLASSLNLNYIDALGDHFRAGTDFV